MANAPKIARRKNRSTYSKGNNFATQAQSGDTAAPLLGQTGISYKVGNGLAFSSCMHLS